VLLLLGLNLAKASSVSLWLNLEMVATSLLGAFAFRDQFLAVPASGRKQAAIRIYPF
jgi:hypothetical protein